MKLKRKKAEAELWREYVTWLIPQCEICNPQCVQYSYKVNTILPGESAFLNFCDSLVQLFCELLLHLGYYFLQALLASFCCISHLCTVKSFYGCRKSDLIVVWEERYKSWHQKCAWSQQLKVKQGSTWYRNGQSFKIWTQKKNRSELSGQSLGQHTQIIYNAVCEVALASPYEQEGWRAKRSASPFVVVKSFYEVHGSDDFCTASSVGGRGRDGSPGHNRSQCTWQTWQSQPHGEVWLFTGGNCVVYSQRSAAVLPGHGYAARLSGCLSAI